MNEDEEDEVERWTFDKILAHITNKKPKLRGQIDVLVKWEGYTEPSWEPMKVIQKDDPITLAKYAQDKGLLDNTNWSWAKRFVNNKKNSQE